jgi:peptidoglycan DL-endopeptidase CwlO
VRVESIRRLWTPRPCAASTPPGHPRSPRDAWRHGVAGSGRVLATALAVATAGTVLAAGPALAQPVLVPPAPAPAVPAAPVPAPTDAAGAAARLEQVQRDAEALTEQWHAAQDAVTAKKAEVGKLRAAVDPLRGAAAKARDAEEGYRTQVDSVALSTFESGRLDTVSALMASSTPQDYLDQMSALEMISSDQAAALDALTTVVERTRRAQDDADAAAARAQTAADDAARAEQDLLARKREADRLVDEAEALLRRLSPRERADRLGPEVDAPPLPSGTGAGLRALRAAAAQLGKAYRWGATGPSTFDCSGLTSFAFRQAGITLPRSSSQQALVGRPVGLDDLQPGDLVFFYSPVSHVGIYAGAGKMIHAPQTGDVVRYQAVNRQTFSGARRL